MELGDRLCANKGFTVILHLDHTHTKPQLTHTVTYSHIFREFLMSFIYFYNYLLCFVSPLIYALLLKLLCIVLIFITCYLCKTVS